MIGQLGGLLIQWSVKVEFCKGDTTFGMWQVVQFLVLTGQAAPGKSAVVFVAVRLT